MAKHYLAQIRYQRENETGILKTINEQYLLKAVSYTDAEAIVFDKVAENVPDFELVKCNPIKLSEIFLEDNNAEKFWKAKVQYISFDEKSQKEKKTAHFMYINCHDLGEVYTSLKNHLGNLNDYEITDVSLTNVLEVWL